jgi:hypothetical protein
MKNVLLIAMLLGLLTGASFAQRGRVPMDTNRGMTQMGPISHTNPTVGTPRYMPNAIQPSARQMPPIANGNATNPSSAGQTSKGTVGSTTSGTPRPVPDAIQPDARQMPPIAHTSAQ